MVTFLDLIQAQRHIRPWVQPSPLEHSRRLSQLLGASVHLKLENFRELRSFKVRGAVNFMVSRLPECRRYGVVAASGGSHALGVAFAAAHLDVQATIVMTERAPANLQNIVASYGAQVEVCGQVYDDASTRAKEIARESGARIIDSFNDPHIIAGQGTIALEIFAELPETDMIICPVGGGGLLAGVALGAKTISPACQIIGVEPEQANAMHRSLAAGQLVEVDNPVSIADKLVTRRTGDLAFATAQPHTDAVYCVTEEQIRQAVRQLLAEASLLAEGAGAAPLALLLSEQVDIRDKQVVLVVTGGNIDSAVLQKILQES